MKQFAALISQLEETTKTARKTQALAQYMSTAPHQDRLWCLPLWLLEETYSVVGDLAETIALVLPEGETETDRSLSSWIDELRLLTKCNIDEKRAFIDSAWVSLNGQERFVFNKLITGGFRVGVSQRLMTRALAHATSKPEAEIAHRLMGNWMPDQTDWHSLIEAEDFTADLSRPFPFFLSHALEGVPEDLGLPSEWSAEWKWTVFADKSS
jgi:DNA ligase-1